MTKNPLFWLERICSCIPFRLVFTLQDRTSGDLDLVWIKVWWKGNRGYRAAISGKLWLSGKMKSNIGCMGDWVVPRFCLSRTAIELDLDLVVGVCGGAPMRSRSVDLWRKLWFLGNGVLKNDEKSVILATTRMVLYPASAGIHVAASNFVWRWPSVASSPMEGLQRL